MMDTLDNNQWMFIDISSKSTSGRNYLLPSTGYHIVVMLLFVIT
jgi:hypothetical protein